MQALDKITLKEMSDELIATHGSAKAALIPILNKLRKNNVTIDATTLTTLAQTLRIAPSAIYGVVSFYSFLDHRPKGKHVIRVCQTMSCKMAGAAKVATALKSELGIEFGETTGDGLFTLEHTNCLGLCSEAPAMLLNETAHIKIDAVNVKDILKSIARATPVASN
ncbi:MAG: NAD(P)H-dependent oxidoreductase subunit E [Deltaproteobacteria bacterium]|nr:NAD(P)H-dependent oxidoreductase subunit E [Deltaproteobacteria bacterium]